MTDAKHTPGPWLIGDVHYHRGEQLHDEYFITAGEPEVSGYCEINIRGDFAKGNALLIAAATDMLEALQNIASALDLESYPGPGSMEYRLGSVARAVIAKATGAA